MGLFDFIKKKLFGKTKKIEETKKKSEGKSIQKESKVLEKATTTSEKKPTALESIKKAIFGDSKKEVKVFLCSFGSWVIATPNNIVKNIMLSMSPFAAADIGLVGIIRIKISKVESGVFKLL